MNWQNVRRILKSDYLILLPVVALAFYIAFIPHLNYPYPVHLDEWTHLACSNQIIEQASVVGLTDPFSGEAPIPNQVLEAGFHLFWAVFHQVSGISWLVIFKYFPGIVFMLTVLSVYVLAHRQGFGWQAALFTCLITTTVGILGPAFMVPIAMGLFFIPLCIFMAFNFRTVWSYVVLFIFVCFLVTLHAPTAVGLVIILAPYILLNLKSNFRHSLGMTLALAIPFLVLLPLIFDILLPTAKLLLSPQSVSPFVDIPRIILTYGYLPTLICLLGAFLLAMKATRESYGLVSGLLAVLLMLVTFFTFGYGISIMFYRGLVILMLMVSIVAGAGLMGVQNLRLPAKLNARLKAPLISRNIGNVLCLVLIGLMLAMGIPSRQSTPYYHMIDDEDYQAFIWIKEKVDSSYETAVLDPWKATAFTAITGRKVVTRIGEYPRDFDQKTVSFLQGGCTDPGFFNFMKNNGISIVYTRSACHNPDLVEVRKNVYLLKEAPEPE